jgi:hypothetical protein
MLLPLQGLRLITPTLSRYRNSRVAVARLTLVIEAYFRFVNPPSNPPFPASSSLLTSAAASLGLCAVDFLKSRDIS